VECWYDELCGVQGEELPSQPTGVRIDSSKLAHIHTELVRLTDNWPVEKIERVNNILAKVEYFSVF
jgi:hypothetical protein